MAKLRYNRSFKQVIIVFTLLILLFSSVVVCFIISKVQYDRLVSDMKPLEASIVHIDTATSTKGPDTQKIYISYVVNGIGYRRKLKTDTKISFEAGYGAHYSVGDKIQIFYDPQNPEIIACPRSVRVGYFWLALDLPFLAIVVWVFLCGLKRHRKFLVTQEEYEKEGEDIKRRKLEKKKQKKKRKLKQKRNMPRREKL